jgi:4-amino-4-deoxy-L-arabinose transferase-like glycosyltransferase
MFSHPMEDGMLTMCTTLAIAAWQRALDTDRRRWMLLAAGWVGLGFQAKMMQAWLVLPALAFAYLVVADHSMMRKLRRLAAAGVVTLAVSLSWMTAIALTPASHRPFIDGTTNNSIYAMVFGYNGINRFFSNFLPGALGADPHSHSATSGVGLVPGVLGHTPLKLLLPQYATQIGWLYPLAAAGLILGIRLVRTRSDRARLGNDLRTGVLLNSGLLVTMVSVMSVMSLPHTAYLASIAFPLAAFAAIGVVLLWRTTGEPGPLRFAAPVTVAVQTAWTVALIGQYPAWSAWAGAVALLGCTATVLLSANAAGRLGRRKSLAPLGVLALAGVMLAPVLWSLSTLIPAYAGTANDAYAGPPPPRAVNTSIRENAEYGIGLDSNRAVDQTADTEARAFRYARERSLNRRFVLATDTWRSAAPLILAGHRRVLPIGGYTSRVASPSLDSVRRFVTDHQLKYVLLTDPNAAFGVRTVQASAVRRWVETSCHLVPEAQYAGTLSSSIRSINRDRLYECDAKRSR